jgi:hypothetical protein
MITRPFVLASLAIAALVVSVPSADAQKRSPRQDQAQGIDRITAPQMAGLLRSLGHQAEVVQENNRTRVRTEIGNRRVSVYFYACNEAGCQSIQYRALFQRNQRFTLAFVNAWNYEKRFAKAYLDSDGDLVLEWDVDFDGGVTVNFMTESVNTFQTMLRAFDSFSPRDQSPSPGMSGSGRSLAPVPPGEAGRGFGGMDAGRSLAPGGGRVTTPGGETGRSVTPGGGGLDAGRSTTPGMGGRSVTPGAPDDGGNGGKSDTGDRPGERRT